MSAVLVKRALAVLAAPVMLALLVGTTGPALADHDDHDRGHDRGDRREWHDRDWARRDHDWRTRGRVWYGDRVYVDPPPAIVYGPPPPPPGLNLMFSFGR